MVNQTKLYQGPTR